MRSVWYVAGGRNLSDYPKGVSLGIWNGEEAWFVDHVNEIFFYIKNSRKTKFCAFASLLEALIYLKENNQNEND